MEKATSTSESQNAERRFDLIPLPSEKPGSEAWGGSGFGHDTAGGGTARYLHALRRHWLMALIMGLPVAAIAGYVTWALQPVLYTATAILRLAPHEAPLVVETADIKANANTFESYKRTQKQLLRSRFVATRALRDETVAATPALQDQPDATDWLESNLNIAFPDESELMTISLTAKKPDGLHLLVNSLVQAYFEEVVFADRNRRLERLNSLELAKEKAEGELRKKRSDLKQLVERVGSGEPGALTAVQQNTLSQYTSYQQKLAQLRFEWIEAQGELEMMEETVNAQDDSQIVISNHELLLAMRTDKECERLRTEKQHVVDHVKATQGRLKNAIPQQSLDEFDRRLEVCDQKIESRKAALRTELIEYKRQSAAGAIDALRRQVALLSAQVKQWDDKARELEAEAKQIGRSSIDVEMLRAEISALQDVSSRLGSEAEWTKIELQPNPANAAKDSSARVSKVVDATPARPADSRSRWTKAIWGGIAGLLLPVCVVVWLDVRKHRVNSGTDVSQALGLTVVGSIPMVPSRIMQRFDQPSQKHQYWRTLLSESVDSIAAVLLRGAKRGEIHVIMISSATAGEGKTTLAANLATSIASTGCQTVLVDFDLRRPALHRVFNLNLQPGINDVLRDPDSFDSAIQYGQIPNLALLSAGRWSATGLAGLASADLKSLFECLRARFQFVVIDGSPILPIVDTRLIAQNVDSVLLSVLRDVSRVPQVQAACDLLAKFSVPIFGVVMTGSKSDAYPDSMYEPYLDTKAV